jgi:Zn-dependent protease with chaperone function
MHGLLDRLQAWILGGLAAVTAVPAAGAAGPVQLAYEPVALAWSASEVERATTGPIEAIVERARRRGELGCRQSCARIGPIFDRLVTLARAQTPRARDLPWSLTVVRTPGIEAMALPGGQVLISEAFIRSSAPDDESLAFVLAHEMAHSILEHERQALHFARLLLPRDVPRSVADMYTEIDYNFGLLKSLEPVLQQGELEADELGLLLASAAGYAPARQLGFVEREARRGEEREPLVRTHPPARVRLERLRERLPLAERLHAAPRP